MSVLSFLALVMAVAALGVSLSSAPAAAKRHRRPQPVEPDKYTRFVIFNGGQRIRIGIDDVVQLTPDLSVINTSGVLRIKQTPPTWGGSSRTKETVPRFYRTISDLTDQAKRKAEASQQAANIARQAAETACGACRPSASDTHVPEVLKIGTAGGRVGHSGSVSDVCDCQLKGQDRIRNCGRNRDGRGSLLQLFVHLGGDRGERLESRVRVLDVPADLLG